MTIYYTVYQTTNLINGKIYIGKHKTTNPYDDYLGSGAKLQIAIEKYGKHNFKKDILYIFDNKNDMDIKERELVNEEFKSNRNTYNVKLGGDGGWDYINTNQEIMDNRNNKAKTTLLEKYGVTNPSQIPTVQEKIKKSVKKTLQEKYGVNHNSKIPGMMEKIKQTNLNKYGKEYAFILTDRSEVELIRKQTMQQKYGCMSSTTGYIWITNNIEHIMVESSITIPDGWRRGMKPRKSKS